MECRQAPSAGRRSNHWAALGIHWRVFAIGGGGAREMAFQRHRGQQPARLALEATRVRGQEAGRDGGQAAVAAMAAAGSSSKEGLSRACLGPCPGPCPGPSQEL